MESVILMEMDRGYWLRMMGELRDSALLTDGELMEAVDVTAAMIAKEMAMVERKWLDFGK